MNAPVDDEGGQVSSLLVNSLLKNRDGNGVVVGY